MSRVLISCLVLLIASSAFAEDKKPEPKGEPVGGKVTFDGKPLPGGTVTFVTKDGKTSVPAKIAEDGTFKATVPTGSYRITVSPVAKKDDPKKYVPIPAKFGDPDTSGLTYEVKAGAQTFDIELKSK